MISLSFDIADKRYSLDLRNEKEISIPLKLDGSGPSHFGVEPLNAKPLHVGEFIGDVSAGGSCNVDLLALVPHCQGTHTETKAHVDRAFSNVFQLDLPLIIPATLISVMPTKAGPFVKGHHKVTQSDDLIITGSELKRKLEKIPETKALIVRTIGSCHKRCSARYEKAELVPYFTPEAMNLIVARGVDHLLVDTPSVDRIYDDGNLANHKIFWGIEDKELGIAGLQGRDRATITEMIDVSDDIKDGLYGLNLSVLRWNTDAVPCKAVIYPTKELS